MEHREAYHDMKPTGILVVRCNEYKVSHRYLLYSDKTGTELFYICNYKTHEQPPRMLGVEVNVLIRQIKNHIMMIKKQPYTELVNSIMINYKQSYPRLELESYLTS